MMNAPRIPKYVLAWFGRLRVAREEIKMITEKAAHLDDGEMIPGKDAVILVEVLEAVKNDADEAIREIAGITDEEITEVTDGDDSAGGGEQQG